MQDTLDALGILLEDFDIIARSAHDRYRAYRPEDLVELDSRAQAACTYAHMVAAADRRLSGKEGFRPIDVRGLKLWLFESANVVFRLKKMDEDGRARNYPTKQARDYDRGEELPNLPMPPVRLTAGYLLDQTATTFIRTQVARPVGRGTMWCAAIIPVEERKLGERAWRDVTRQKRF
jgi:hypothetical protein